MGNSQSAPQEEGPPPYSRVSERVPQPTRWVQLEELAVSEGTNYELERALIEMTVCRNIFDSWANKVNESSSRKPSKLEKRIRDQIGTLQDSAESALLQTEHIVKAHLSFSQIMVQRLQDTSDSGGVLAQAPEISQAAEAIRKHSEGMSLHVEGMCYALYELTETLQEVQQKDKTLKARILRWFARIFKRLGYVLGVGAPVAALFEPFTAMALGVGSVIFSAASSAASSMSKNAGDRDFDGILDFLRNTVPQEAEEVKQSLQVFNEVHQALQLELEIAKGAVLGVQPGIALKAESLWNCRKVKLELVPVRG